MKEGEITMENRNSAFCVRLADVVIGIEPMYPYLQEYCKDYIVEDTPEFVVRSEPEDIRREREASDREAAIEGHPPVDYADAYLETLAVYRKIAERLLERNILLFHGSVIAVDGEGYLFTAKSGTGKSTHTKLWRQLFGERAVMVNDDKPLLRLTEREVIVYGTPWAGKHNLNKNISVPLAGLCVLERAEKNYIRQVVPRDIYGMLLQQAYRPAKAEAMQQTLSLVDRLMTNVKMYRLGCNMELEAAQVAYTGMRGE